MFSLCVVLFVFNFFLKKKSIEHTKKKNVRISFFKKKKIIKSIALHPQKKKINKTKNGGKPNEQEKAAQLNDHDQ